MEIGCDVTSLHLPAKSEASNDGVRLSSLGTDFKSGSMMSSRAMGDEKINSHPLSLSTIHW